MTGAVERAVACPMTDSEWAPQPWSAETTRPSSGAYALTQAPNRRPSWPLSGTKNPQLRQCAGAALARGDLPAEGRQDARASGRGQFRGLGRPGVRIAGEPVDHGVVAFEEDQRDE